MNWSTSYGNDFNALGGLEIAIVAGYRSEMLADHADREFHNSRWAETNMVSSLATAAEWLLESL